ncbi:hypothetical protein HNR46_000016 [Haloferula luteola]|uniref:Uncharacterized protein n=1 Tax=Haloferula luteola TaxID=595692 RepID=A0A840UVQ2_9BACT|nr:hypothetical protein [Haloferula luteola]MBB5349795.1 hypothetical protein [Haloferula luteola]
MEDDALQLRDLAPIDPLLPEWIIPWWLWLAAALILIGLVLLAIAIVRRSRKPPSLAALSHAAYRRAVADLKALPDDFHEAVIAASSILRAYLVEASGDPAWYETHEEFSARETALQDLPPELRTRAADFLNELSQWKYDRPREGSGPEVATRARHMLDEIHKARPA